MKKLALLSLLLTQTVHGEMIAHEWGTFTSLMGASGVRQHGMYHEDEELPSFVHQFGEDTQLHLQKNSSVADANDTSNCRRRKVCDNFINDNQITQKMETPVLYFYSKEEQNVMVDVGFPDGVIAQSFPKAEYNFPIAADNVKFKNGFAHYSIQVLKQKDGYIPFDDKGNIYIHARNVNSNLIKSGNEQEKYIFYRGVGDFKTDVSITSINDKIKIANNGKEITSVFILDSQNGTGDIVSLGRIGTDQSLTLGEDAIKKLRKKHLSQNEFVAKSRNLLVNALKDAGLYLDEANAMINTWENGYLKTNGLRVLYVLNREEVERILPMNITPYPKQLVRAFIGRIEVLTQNDEKKLLSKIRQEGIHFQVDSLGRMAHPILNRLKEVGGKLGIDKVTQTLLEKWEKEYSLH